jgi:hypothetical protein
MKQRKGRALLAGAALLACAAFAHGAPQAGKSHDNDPDMIEIRHYRLTLDKAEKAASATEEFNKMVASDPALKKRVDAADDQDKTIDEKVKSFETKYPEAIAVLHRNGISTREYVVVSLALLNDMLVVGMKKQGSIKEYPANMITPENATFVEQNYDKLSALMSRMTPPDNSSQN